MITEKHFIVATAGHVDHGKSSLVKALTGTDPDRLPEEKARGITIDLGFAELNLTGRDGERLHVGIVDVPGHEDFVRNMIAGVGSIDLALLVVAADDGWMPQTEEHLQILEYLGVKRAVIAITKIDIADADKAEANIRTRLADTCFAAAPAVRTSVADLTGQDSLTAVVELKQAIASELSKLQPARDFGKARLFIDRVFTLRGIGTVATGSLSGGTLQRSQSIWIQPGNRQARIRSIQSHNRELETAQPGMRTAINLPDIVIGPDGIQRGNVVIDRSFDPGSRLDVVLTRSSRCKPATPMKSGASAYVHHGTTRVLAKIILPETNLLSAGESALAELRLDAPLVAFVGDRLIVRDASERHTLAGGVIVSVDSIPFGSGEQRKLLASRAVAPNDVALAVWTEISAREVIDPTHLLEWSQFSAPEISGALQKLANHGEIFLRDTVAAKMLVWRSLRERAVKIIEAAHKTHPEQRGLELNELRTALTPMSPAIFDALIADLCESDCVRAGSTVGFRAHQPKLPPELKTAADKIRAVLGEKLVDPPARASVATMPQALRFLIEHQEVIEISADVILLQEAVEKMKGIIATYLSEHGSATASELRQIIGTSRRVIIPFLEFLDRTGMTQRDGDLRKLRTPRSTRIAPR